MTLPDLLAEGVFEVGRPAGTSVLFIVTEDRTVLTHASSLPERRIDDYAVGLAVARIDGQGESSARVARDLGVSQESLRRALSSFGYERASTAIRSSPDRAGTARRSGNRRGRLILIRTAEGREHDENDKVTR